MATWQTIRIANPRRARRNNVISDALVGKITDSVASRVGKMFSKSKRKKVVRRKGRRNPHLALIGANPRGLWTFGKPRRKRAKKKLAKRWADSEYGLSGSQKKKHRRKVKRTIARGLFGNTTSKGATMARRRRSRKRNSLRGRARDSKGRLLKVGARKRSNPKRRRRTSVARATPRRRRRRNKARVRTVIRYRNRTKIKYRTRRINVARKRRRKSVRRRSRRRNMAALAAVNPRRRRRRSRVGGRRRRYNAGGRRRRYSRRRRNAGLGGLVGRVNFMQVAEVAGGVFLGDKITNYVSPYITNAIGITDSATVGLVKAGLGVVTAGLIWKFRPALGLGIAVGAANALLNQYVFNPIWGYATPYLPGGMAGLGEYVPRGWKMDNWLAEGGAGVAGMGQNKLLTKGL